MHRMGQRLTADAFNRKQPEQRQTTSTEDVGVPFSRSSQRVTFSLCFDIVQNFLDAFGDGRASRFDLVTRNRTAVTRERAHVARGRADDLQRVPTLERPSSRGL